MKTINTRPEYHAHLTSTALHKLYFVFAYLNDKQEFTSRIIYKHNRVKEITRTVIIKSTNLPTQQSKKEITRAMTITFTNLQTLESEENYY